MEKIMKFSCPQPVFHPICSYPVYFITILFLMFSGLFSCTKIYELGEWEEKSVGTVYLAETDGFIDVTVGNSQISLTLNNSLRVSGELFITVDPGGCPLNDPPRIYKLKIDTNPPPGVPIVGPFLVVAESDLDGDGLTFLQEENQNTLPDKWDSDNDGVSDANDKFPNDPFRHK